MEELKKHLKHGLFCAVYTIFGMFVQGTGLYFLWNWFVTDAGAGEISYIASIGAASIFFLVIDSPDFDKEALGKIDKERVHLMIIKLVAGSMWAAHLIFVGFILSLFV